MRASTVACSCCARINAWHSHPTHCAAQVLYNVPGSDITSAPTLLATVVLQVIFIFGLLVFATILAMISEEVNTMLLTARSGKAPLQM